MDPCGLKNVKIAHFDLESGFEIKNFISFHFFYLIIFSNPSSHRVDDRALRGSSRDRGHGNLTRSRGKPRVAEKRPLPYRNRNNNSSPRFRRQKNSRSGRRDPSPHRNRNYHSPPSQHRNFRSDGRGNGGRRSRGKKRRKNITHSPRRPSSPQRINYSSPSPYKNHLSQNQIYEQQGNYSYFHSQNQNYEQRQRQGYDYQPQQQLHGRGYRHSSSSSSGSGTGSSSSSSGSSCSSSSTTSSRQNYHQNSHYSHNPHYRPPSSPHPRHGRNSSNFYQENQILINTNTTVHKHYHQNKYPQIQNKKDQYSDGQNQREPYQQIYRDDSDRHRSHQEPLQNSPSYSNFDKQQKNYQRKNSPDNYGHNEVEYQSLFFLICKILYFCFHISLPNLLSETFAYLI